MDGGFQPALYPGMREGKPDEGQVAPPRNVGRYYIPSDAGRALAPGMFRSILAPMVEGSAPVPVTGLYESHLTVSDLARSIEFYRDVVRLEMAHTVPKRHAAFFWIGGRDRSMLGLWSIHSSPVRLRLHIAFQAELEQVVRFVDVLRFKGIVPRHGGGGPEVDEPVVFP